MDVAVAVHLNWNIKYQIWSINITNRMIMVTAITHILRYSSGGMKKEISNVSESGAFEQCS